jgi:hypothetical protein
MAITFSYLVDINRLSIEQRTDEKSAMKHKHVTYHLSNIRGEVVTVHAIKAYKGSTGIPPLIFNLGTRWK